MEHYGDYEVVKEIPAIESAVFTTYTARKTGSTAVAFVIRVFRPLDTGISIPDSDPDAEFLPESQLTTYIQGVKQQQKASVAGARSIAPVHALGIDPRGAWYVTDYYPRGTLKRLIQGQYQVDENDLFHVVDSMVRGLLELKVHAGRSHGNLTSNLVLISGKKGKRLCHTRLLVSDPQPGLQDKANAFEIADLHSIGEIIYQLIRRREVSGVANWPVQQSGEWSVLEQSAKGWRDLCNELLDPNLSLESINLEKLKAKVLQLRPKRAVRLPVYGVIGGVIILCGVVAFLQFSKDSKTENNKIIPEGKKVERERVEKGSHKTVGLEKKTQVETEEERRDAELQARIDAERRLHAEEEKRRLQEEARLKAEAKARAEAEAKRLAEEKRRAEEEARRKAEAEERAKLEAEEEARLKAEAKVRAEAEAKRLAEEKRRAEEEARRKAEAERQAKLEAEEKARREAEEKARIEEEERLAAEAEAKRLAEEKRRAEEEAQLKAEIAKFATNFEVTNSIGMLLVKVSEDFWVGRYETTQAEYEEVVGVNPSTVKGAKLPVDGVSFQDALKFCKLLTERDKGRIPQGFQYTLPTENQWRSFVSDARIQDSVTSKDRTTKRVQPEEVGSTGIANQFGLFDVRGNVWEWCFNDDPENRPVLKGGAFDGRIEHGPLGNLSLGYRFMKKPDSPTPAAGIRLILVHKP